MGSATLTASFNGKPLLLTPNTKEEGKTTGKQATSPFSLGVVENAEEEA
jgi:hypothetical protein